MYGVHVLCPTYYIVDVPYRTFQGKGGKLVSLTY